MLVKDCVAQVRSLVTGSLLDEVSILAQDYDPASDENIFLKYPKRSLASGSVVCVGLNTFMVLAASADGSVLTVLPSADGGPDVAVPAGSVVTVKPHLTTYAAYREIKNEAQGISSRQVGLFAVWEYVVTHLNRHSGTYPLDGLSPVGQTPFRLLRCEFRYAGTTTWQTFTDAEWQTFSNTIRVFQDPPGAIEYRFSLAIPFGEIISLDQNLNDIGVNDTLSNILALGAAATMAIGWEGRRVQPLSQGDSRRSAEVGVGSNAGLAQRLRQMEQENINEEVARLIAKYGYRQPGWSGQTSYGRYGTYGGWR